MNNFGTFDLASTYATAEQAHGQHLRNQLLGYQVQQTEQQEQNRQRVSQIRQMFDSAPEVIAQLEADGFIDQANELRESTRAQLQSTLQIFENLDDYITEDNYQQMRQKLIQEGIVDPDLMPVEYNKSFFDREQAKVKNQLKKITFRSADDAGNVLAQDLLVDEYGETVREGEPYRAANDVSANRPRTGRGGSGDGSVAGRLKATDVNAIARQVERMFGGTYDPQTGRFTGLERDAFSRAQALQEEAERLFAEEGMSHGQAVAEAARNMGISVPSTNNPDVASRLDKRFSVLVN